MKKTLKKSLCILLAVLCAFACCTAAFAAKDVTPVIVISGIGTTLINADRHRESFPPETGSIVANVLLALNPVLGSIIFHSDFLLDKFGATPIHAMFADLACDENGDSIKNIKYKSYDNNLAYYVKKDGGFKNGGSNETGVARAIGEEIGWKNVYYFDYDWRRSPLDIAKDLDVLVEKAKAEAGSDKVTLVPLSMGGVITTAYLAQFGYDSIKTVVLASTAFQGVDLVGNLFVGDVEITMDSVLTYLTPFLAANGQQGLSDFAAWADKKCEEDGMESTNAYIKKNIENLEDTVYSKVFMDTFMRFLGIWSFVPPEQFDEALEFVQKHTVLSDSFIEKAAKMNDVTKNAPKMIKAMQQDGVNVYIIGAYGFAGIPLTPGSVNQCDTLIDTYRMTGNCAVAPYGKTLEGMTYSHDGACGNKSHYHASTDGIIDASVGLLPEQTWIIKNMTHVEFNYEHGTSDLIVWLATGDEPLNIYSDARYPQFTELDRETGKLSSLTQNVEIPEIPEEEEDSELDTLNPSTVFGKIIKFFKTLFESISLYFA